MRRAPRSGGKLLTLRQAEAEYGLPYHTLWMLVDRGLLPRLEIPMCRAIYVRRDDLDHFIAANMSEVRP
jgi:hypothetical protein